MVYDVKLFDPSHLVNYQTTFVALSSVIYTHNTFLNFRTMQFLTQILVKSSVVNRGPQN